MLTRTIPMAPRRLIQTTTLRLFTTSGSGCQYPLGPTPPNKPKGNPQQPSSNTGDIPIGGGNHNPAGGRVPGTNGVPTITVTAPPGGGAAKFGTGKPSVGPKK